MKQPEYEFCPNCKIKFPSSGLKRRSDEGVYGRASPPITGKRRCLGWKERIELIKKWKPYSVHGALKSKDSETRGRCSIDGKDKEEQTDGAVRRYADADVVEEVATECSTRILGAESPEAEIVGSGEYVEITDSDEIVEVSDTGETGDIQNSGNIIEIADSKESAGVEIAEGQIETEDDCPPPEPRRDVIPDDRELRAKFKELPKIKGEKVGNLVEIFQQKNPKVEITNLYQIPWVVDSVRDCEWDKNGCKFRVRWDGFSEGADTWESEGVIQGYATPALSLHICEFFLTFPRALKDRERRFVRDQALKYFHQYVKSDLLESQSPDYLVLSKLADEELSVRNDCVLMPKEKDIDRMRKRIESLLKEKEFERLFKRFDGELGSFVKFASARMEMNGDFDKRCRTIAYMEPRANISIKNFVDCETLPSDFCYITDLIVSDKVIVIPPEKTCACEENVCFGSKCCGRHYSKRNPSISYRAYKWNRLFKACEKVPLFECNSGCSCGPSCENRLIQNGSQLSLTIFKTCNRGWGVKADTSIQKGTFIGEYVGELLTSEEANYRQTINFAYLFNLNPIQDKEVENVVDAAKFGNFTRFFNHSCEPNMDVSYAYIENHNLAAPRLAFFARRNINKGEELTFDYKMQTTDGSGYLTPARCYCAAAHCRNFLF